MYIALDLETTGLSPEKDQIIEVAAVRLNEDGTIQDEFQTLINPKVALPEIIRHLTGLTDDDLKDAPTIDEVRAEIINFIGDAPILGHSVQFDIDFLAANDIPLKGAVLDTFHLSQTLLINEASYSLEILSEKFDLTHESKHRALDDTKVAIALYELLVKKIQEIPFAAAEQIRDLLKKSDWGWEKTFLNHLETKEKTQTPPSITNPPPHQGTLPELQQKVQTTLTNNQNAIFEAPQGTAEDLAIAAINFAEQSGEKCLLVTSEPQNIARDARVAHLQHPARYLCQTRFNEFLQKDHFDIHETRLLVKIFLWLARGGTGEKNEIIVGDDEHPVWEQISALPHLYESCGNPDCYYQKAFQNATYAPLLVISQHLYIDNFTRRGTLIPKKPHHLIEGLELIEETALLALTKYYALSRLANIANRLDEQLGPRFEIFFGLLGMFIDKYAAPDAYQKQVILDPTLLATPEAKKILGTLSNLEENISKIPDSPNQKLLKKDLEILQKAFAGSPEVLTWIMLSYDNEPVIRTCPKRLAPLLKQELWDKTEGSLIFLSHYGSLESSFAFLKNRLLLPQDLPEIFFPPETQNQTLEIYPHPELPHPRKPNNLQATIEFIKKEGLKNNTFLLANSISAVDSLHQKLAEPLKKAEVMLLSQGISGGMGKIGQRFKKAQENVLIIGNERLYRSILKNTPNSAKKIETLLIHRLPFLPPSHPVHQKECEGLSNSWYDYSLPQAILRLKRFLYLATTKTSVHEIHILDPRFDDYDQKFRKSVKNVCQKG